MILEQTSGLDCSFKIMQTWFMIAPSAKDYSRQNENLHMESSANIPLTYSDISLSTIEGFLGDSPGGNTWSKFPNEAPASAGKCDILRFSNLSSTLETELLLMKDLIFEDNESKKYCFGLNSES